MLIFLVYPNITLLIHYFYLQQHYSNLIVFPLYVWFYLDLIFSNLFPIVTFQDL